MGKNPYLTVLPAVCAMACVSVQKPYEPSEVYEPSGIMRRGLYDCAGVMRARFAGLLEDPHKIEERFGLSLEEDEIIPDDRVDPAGSETLYGTDALYGELLYGGNWKSARFDWAYFELENWEMKKYPVLEEFRKSLKLDMTGEWYIYIWEILNKQGKLPQDQSERRVAPILLMERFAIELKNHLVEHGFGDDDWLRAAMCSDDYDFFGKFMEFYLYELLEVGLPHEGAFQSARADVVVEYEESGM